MTPKVGRGSAAGTVRVGNDPKLPTNTKARARNALARLDQAKGLTPGQRASVVNAAYARLGTPARSRKVKP